MWQKIVLLLLGMVLAVPGELMSQPVAIQNDQWNTGIVGLDLPLTIVAEGVPCEKLRVNAQTGSLWQTDPCRYAFRGNQPGTYVIQVFHDTVLLDQTLIRLKRWPNPSVRLGNKHSGRIGFGEFKAQGGLIAWIDNLDIDAKGQVVDFQVQLIRYQEAYYVQKNIGGRFEESLKKAFEQLEPGDQVHFSKIRVRMPGESGSREMPSLFFTIR